MIRRLSVLLIGMVCLTCATVTAAQDNSGSDDCSVDITDIRALLATAQTELDAGDIDTALARIALAEADLEAILTACTDKDIGERTGTPRATFTQEIILREALPNGNLLVRYPDGWYAEVIDDQVQFATERAALNATTIIPGAQAGALIAFTPDMLAVFGLDADADTAAVVSVLTQRFADAFDNASLDDVVAFSADTHNAAIITGTAIENEETVQVAFVVVDLEAAFVFIFLATDDANAPYEATIQMLAAELSYIADIDNEG